MHAYIFDDTYKNKISTFRSLDPRLRCSHNLLLSILLRTVEDKKPPKQKKFKSHYLQPAMLFMLSAERNNK